MKRFRKFTQPLEIVFIVVILCIQASCSKGGGDAVIEPIIVNYPKNVLVEYRITSIAGGIASITAGSYTNLTGGSTNLNDTPLPYVQKFNRTVNRGDEIAVSILHNNSVNNNSFSIRLDILVDDVNIKTQTFSGTGGAIGAVSYLFP